VTRLRIVNLNTWIGLLVRGLTRLEKVEPPGHKRRRFDAMVAELKVRAPDVVTLQECLPLPALATDLAEALDYEVVWQVANSGLRLFGFGLPTGIGRGEGLTVLARRGLGLEHLETKRLSGRGLVNDWFSFQAGPVRIALACRVHLDGSPVIVVNTHVRYGFPNHDAFWEGWRTLRERGVVTQAEPPGWLLKLLHDNRTTRDLELKRLADWVGQLRREHQAPVVIGADFNLDPDTPQMAEFLAETGFTNALPRLAPGALTWDPGGNYNIGFGTKWTWDNGKPKSMILQLMAYLDLIPQTPDHVMFSPGLTLTDGGVAFEQPHEETLASDHYGVWADASVEGVRRAGLDAPR
jgi:endonuclease/exonuclease/phosphatase family metal-dependent hydrolase